MTRITRLINREYLFTATIAFILSMAAVSANALDKEQARTALDQIYQIQISSYYSVNGFYNFSANQGDQQHLANINTATAKINGLLTELSSAFGKAPEAETLKPVDAAWKAYRKVLEQNVAEIRKTGYPDLRLAGDMPDRNIAFNKEVNKLYETIANENGNKPSEVTELSRQAATTLALMMTKYSARSTSTVSQVYTGGDTDVTIDALAKEYEETISKLADLIKANKDAAVKLDSANTKWDFIRYSYINYNENRVNYIVNLYSTKIISDIETAVAAIN